MIVLYTKPESISDLISSAVLFQLSLYRMWLPYLKKLGPKWFRRWLVDMIPNEQVKRLKEIVDILDVNTRRIFFGKMAALEAGDAAVKEQVSNGKDIMSILCKSSCIFHFEMTNIRNLTVRENLNASDEDRLSEEELLGQMS